jgi:hypothetical protein
MFVIVLNQANLVPDGYNNKLVYRFPNSVSLKDKYIAVSNVSMFYSWFNITSTYQNNTFTYTWTAGGTTTTYNIIIPDGLYEIAAINHFCQFTMIQNGTYWIDASGDYVYPFEILLNPQRYAIQINTYLVPTSTPALATTPANFPGWPTVPQNPVITIPSKFNIIVGYTAGFATNANLNNTYTPPTPTAASNYAAKDAVGTLSYLSNTSPQVQPFNNVLFSISNINNPYSQPSSIIFSLNPNVGVGEQIFVTPPNFMWNKLIDGTYNELRLSFLSNDLQPLIIKDPNMTILLTIRDRDEGFLATK